MNYKYVTNKESHDIKEKQNSVDSNMNYYFIVFTNNDKSV